MMRIKGWAWAVGFLVVWLCAPRLALASPTENFSSGTLGGAWPSQWTLEATASTSFITTTAAFSTTGQLGRMSGASGSGGIEFLTAPGMTVDSDQSVNVATSNSNNYADMIARRGVAGTYYGCLVGSANRLRFYKVVGGVYAQVGPVALPTPPAGVSSIGALNSWYRLRFKITQNANGTTTLQAKLWQGSEPSGWTLELASPDGEPTLQNVAGYAGIGAAAGTSTNQFVYFDDYAAVDQVRLWSSASTWGTGGVPTAATNVVVPTGYPVRLDVAPTVASIRIPAGATLEFDPNSSRYLQSAGNVEVRGTLRMRPASAQVRHTLRIINAIEPNFIGSQTPDDMNTYPVASDPGVWVLGAGQLDLEGTHKTSWLRASTASNLAAGQTALTLESAPAGWQPDDELAITPTDYPNEDLSPIYHSEVRKVDLATGAVVGLKPQPFVCGNSTNTYNSVYFPTARLNCPNEDCCANQSPPPGKTMPANGGLLFSHPVVPVNPVQPKSAEVLNLTRNVIIEGFLPTVIFPRAGNYPAEPGRTHLLIHNDVPVAQNIKYVTLRYMGPRQVDPASPNDQSRVVKGRYALHFHHCMENSIGTMVEGVVVRDSQTHAFVPHASDGITFKDTIAYNTVDDAYWWDPAPSTDPDQIMNATTNGVVYNRTVAALVSTDNFIRGYRLTGFLLGIGVGNEVHDAVAVSILGNVNASGFEWPEQANFQNNVWNTTDMVTHNNRVDGVFVWQNDNHFHNIHGLVAYHNQKTGIEHGAYTNSYRYENGFLYGNGWSGRASGGFAQIVVNAVSHPTHLITFADMTVDAAGRTPNILAVYDVRVTTPTVPALFLNMKTGGNTGPIIGVNLTPVAPGIPVLLADFVNWTKLGSGAQLDPATDVSTLALSAGSVLRFQQGLLSGGPCTAEQITSASSTPQALSACFY